MKLLLLSPAHPLRGGIAASSERLAQEFTGMGHAVVVYSFSLQYPRWLFPGKTQYTRDPAPQGLVIKTRLNSVNPFNWPVVGREMRRERADRIVARFWLPFMAMSTGTALRFAGGEAPVTGLVDNFIPHEKRPGDALLARYFAGACTDFVAMSRSVQADLQAATGKPVGYAPHPVYDIYGEAFASAEARRQLNLPPDKPLVLFFGLIRTYKGLDLLLDAMPHCPDVHVVVAGEPYGDWAPYQSIIDRHGLSARVHLFLDFVPNQQVAAFFSATDLVVQPYRSATQSGISQIACHFEKPMVVTDVGGLPETVTDGKTGYVVPADPVAIAGAIRTFFGAPPPDMPEALLNAKARFSWRNLAQTLLGEK
ncbi:MAG: glycosyltransferase [Saprospiraceae bacterium]|nr:glycosyltransferase [Saprospiraceae bacterium]